MSAASLRTVRGTLSACCLGLTVAVLFNFVTETTDTTSEKRLEAGPFVLLSAANRAYKAPVCTSLIYRSFGRRTVLIRNVASMRMKSLGECAQESAVMGTGVPGEVHACAGSLQSRRETWAPVWNLCSYFGIPLAAHTH